LPAGEARAIIRARMTTQSPLLPHDAISSSLGPPLRTFRVRLPFLIGVGATSAGFLLMGIFAVVRLIVSLVRGDEEMIVVGAIAAVAFLLPGVIALVWVLRRYKRSVTVCAGGLFITDARGRGRSIAWHDVNGVTHKIVRVMERAMLGEAEEVGVRDEYTLFLRNDEKVHVDYHFADVEALGQAILEQTTAALLPGMRQAFHAGQSIGFGPIAIDRYRVHVGGSSIGWEEVSSLEWKTGLIASERAYLHVNRGGAWLAWGKVPVDEVVNYTVLMALAREMGKA
jgi:uncharacterized protein DUF6585